VAGATFTRDARKLGLGDADRCLADGPIDCHSSPHVLILKAKPYSGRPNARA
jgi:hypothetical protein